MAPNPALDLVSLGLDDLVAVGLEVDLLLHHLLVDVAHLGLVAGLDDALYALVGAQMAWILRPFIGSPHYVAFRWFRPRGGNVFIDIIRTIGEFLGGCGQVIANTVIHIATRLRYAPAT